MWMYNLELYHHGIKGQRWGIRRFQNRDGSLTSQGKKRYRDDEGNLTPEGKAHKEERERKITLSSGGLRKSSEIARESSNIARKAERLHSDKQRKKMDVSKMSDQELRERVNRLNLERNYKNLMAEEKQAGKIYVSDVLEVAGNVLTIGASAATIAYTVSKMRK